ncbi:MAG: hypothetical protein Q7T51_03990 [Candidatus Moranbacteria bacterium]|nr:hypothetical protein [Candidatus Moranbacteria bacterium]
MLKDVKKPEQDELFKFALAIIISVFLIVVVSVSYEITQLI